MSTLNSTLEAEAQTVSASDGFADFDLFGDTDRGDPAAPDGDQSEPNVSLADGAAKTSSAANTEGGQSATAPDPSLKPDGSPGDQDTASAAQGDKAAQAEDERRTVPLATLLEERQARQALKAERDAAVAREQASQQQLREWMQQFANTQAQNEAARRAAELPKAPAVAIPDPVLDPAGYSKYVDDLINARVAERTAPVQRAVETAEFRQRFQMSERMTAEKYGAQTVDALKAWVNEQGDEAGTYFSSQSDPYGAALQAWQRQEALRVVGNDPQAFANRIAQITETKLRAQIEQEARAKVIEEMRAGAPPPSRIPSLVNAPRGGAKTSDDSSGSFADFGASFLNA